jgi:predicted O-methyltransferase YrrM
LEIVDTVAQAYAERHTSPDEQLLAELEEWTVREHAEPHMISGRLQGQLLGQLSRMVAPERILEIGTFVGYSALCLARGLKPGGRLYTLEIREEDARLARSWFDRSPLGSQIECLQGDALTLMETLDETWDLVFLDADKVNYTRYYEAVLPRLRPGGWIIADNVFFHGQVLEQPVKGKSAKAIEAFNEHVSNDPRVETVMLTVRDGLMIIRKK